MQVPAFNQDPASISTSNFDPRLVHGTQYVCGTWILPEALQYVALSSSISWCLPSCITVMF